MPLSTKLDRKLRAADESSDGEEYYEVTDRSSSASVIDGGDGGGVISSDEDENISAGEDGVGNIAFAFASRKRSANFT